MSSIYNVMDLAKTRGGEEKQNRMRGQVVGYSDEERLAIDYL